MCGIAGYFVHIPLGPDATLARVRMMTDRLAHRGPDSDGHWIDADAGVALGHRRLAILDVTPAGAQPMHSHDGRYVLTYNGEVYNHHDVRRELEAAVGPIAWRGHSDTEVVLEAIAHWGVDAVLPRLDGMFAFGLYDRQARTLTLARDRFGEKPLYFGWIGATFAFASELKALHAVPGFDGALDREAVAEYLRFGYVPAPRSIHRGIGKLSAAHALTVRVNAAPGSPLVPAPYWSAIDAALRAREAPFQGSLQDALTGLDALLRDAVDRRMEADVPLGALLSGGIDSSLVVALMQAQRGDRVRTFSIGSAEPGYDEAVHARAVAAHLGTDHTELEVGAADALAVIPRLPVMYDEPFADSSQIPTHLVSALARKHVTVALSGDAGDELFGGYNRYFHGERVWRQMRRVPRRGRTWLARAATAFGPATLDRTVAAFGAFAPRELAAGRAGEKLHKLAGLLPAADERAFHAAMLAYWPDPASLVPGATGIAGDDPLAGHPGLPFAERAMLLDTVGYLPEDVLTKVDRASMSVSLEARVPLLDRRVFEFAWSLPLGMKIAEGHGKHVLRQLLYRYVPAAIVDRPKQGFAVPIGRWLREDLRDWAEELLAPERLARDDLLDPAPIRRAWQEHLSGARNWDTRLWSVLMLQAWRAQPFGAQSP